MPKLPILMYHNVSTTRNSEGLTISTSNLEEQFAYLKEKGYKSLHFSDLSKLNKLPKKTVIITFDDVYVNQLELAYPLLLKYNLKACFYIPFQYVDGFDDWNSGQHKIMSIEQLKSLDSNFIELGFHSYSHKKYNQLSQNEVEADFKKCHDFIKQHKLNLSNVLAYPYGKYPRKNPEKETFFNTLKNQQIQYGLRIGNRVNSYPFKNNYEIQRTDIKGEDTLQKFKLKLKFGKLKLF